MVLGGNSDIQDETHEVIKNLLELITGLLNFCDHV
jgi:hypothetical protein